MSSRVILNPGSLNLVRPELAVLIKQAHGEFDLAIQPGSEHGLEACRTLLAQIDGVLRLIELSDAACLSRELQALLGSTPEPGSRAAQAAVHGFFVLSRYLDYLAGRRQAIPDLLIDEINALRMLRGEPALAEWHFAQGMHRHEAHAPGSVRRSIDPAVVKRLRHMYQVGLLGFLKGRFDPVNHHLVQRAATRMLRLAGGGSQADFWWLLEALLEAVAAAEIPLTPGRLRLLSRADRQFRDASTAGAVDEETRAAFLLLLGKTRQSAKADAVCQAFGVERLFPGDRELVEERRLLMGTSVASIDSMARALRGDVLAVKTELERAAAAGSLDSGSAASIRDTLRRVAGTLRDGGLAGTSATLETQLDRIASQGAALSREEIMSVADAMVGVEATLTGLSSAQGLARALREQMRGEGGEDAGRQLLDEARIAMLGTAREAIDQVKIGVTGYVEGDFERSALVPAASHLEGVRGALLILERGTAGGLVAEAAAMVAAVAEARVSVASDPFAESLADLLICVEYYLTALEYSEDPDPLMLKLGRESLLAMRASVTGAS